MQQAISTDVIRDNGPRRRLKSLFLVLGLLFSHDSDLFFYELSKRIPDALFKFNSGTVMSTREPQVLFRNYKNFVTTKICPDDYRGIFMLTGVSETESRRRAELGDWGFVTKDLVHDNKIVAVQWVHAGHCYIRGFGLDLDLDEDSIYLFGAFSAPEVRMTGVFNSLLNETFNLLKSQNAKAIYCLIEYWNKRVYNYNLGLNFTPLARVKYIKIFPLRISIRTDLVSKRKSFKVFFHDRRDYI